MELRDLKKAMETVNMHDGKTDCLNWWKSGQGALIIVRVSKPLAVPLLSAAPSLFGKFSRIRGTANRR